MKDLLEKLSSYNIFNYLLPGVIFVVLAEALTTFHFVQEDIVLGVFLYYFIGLIISRLGSLVVEPLLKLLRFVRFAPYADFVTASKEDEKLLVLSEASNMYRTFCTLFVLLALLKGYDRLSSRFSQVQHWGGEILVIALFALFCLSYRKQCQYIRKRIDSNIKKKESNHG